MTALLSVRSMQEGGGLVSHEQRGYATRRRSLRTWVTVSAAFAFLVAIPGLVARAPSTDVPRAPAAQASAARASLHSGLTDTARLPFLAGVVEGFYGPSWSVSDTLHMFAFMHRHYMNAFIYAPKYDPYERAEWRLPYPSGALSTMRSLVSGAQADHIQFVYSISPGLSITYSSVQDRRLLLAKINQLRSLGVHTFMLSLDDIVGNLDAADNAYYKGNLAHAQSSLADYVWREETAQDPHFRLLLAETQYFGTADTPYWEGLKRYLLPAIEPIWTGSWVLANTMTVAQVQAVERDMGHRLIIWDNYPVNDFTYVVAKKPELFLGPLLGRAAGIPVQVAGYFFNPMYQARASELALWTAGDYLHDPAHYQPYVSWQAALRAIGGPAFPALKLLAQDESSRYYDDLQPPLLQQAVRTFWAEEPTAPDLTRTALYQQFQSMATVDQRLASGLPDPHLYQEIAPFSKLLSLQGRVGMMAIGLLQQARRHQRTTVGSASLRHELASMEADPDVVAGTVVQTFVEDVLAKLRS